MNDSAGKPSFIQPGFGNDWLENMHEIAMPHAISMLPGTWGWGLVGVLLVLVILYYGWRRFNKWKSMAYQRQAVQQLRRLAEQCQHDQLTLNQLRQIPVLLKRVAMREYSRRQLAGLSGQAWLIWLDATLPGDQFVNGPGAILVKFSYAADEQLGAIDRSEVLALLQLLLRWLQRPRELVETVC